MDLRKLEIFVRVAELGSFSQAAQSLHMAQPAVSIAVRKLEESLDVVLFDRSGRRVELTAEGRNLLQRAQLILRDVAELKQSTSGMKNLILPEAVRSVLLCPDGDPEGRRAADDAAARFLDEGRGVSIAPTPEGQDLNDVLCAGD